MKSWMPWLWPLQHDATRLMMVASESRSAAEAMSKDGDHHRNVELNREFHTAIYYACHNLVLIELLDVLWDRADRCNIQD